MPIRLFASHAWAATDKKDELANWLAEPLDDPSRGALRSKPIALLWGALPGPSFDHRGDAAYAAALERDVSAAHILVTPIGMYATHSRWLTRELAVARKYGRPTLAVNPWGPLRAPSMTSAAAALTVEWDRFALREAIWSLSQTDVEGRVRVV